MKLCEISTVLFANHQVMKKAIVNFDSAYYVENLRVRGKVCRTNLPSNTACRGLAAPQAMLIMENIIKDVSSMLNMPPHMVLSVLCALSVTVCPQCRDDHILD